MVKLSATFSPDSMASECNCTVLEQSTPPWPGMVRRGVLQHGKLGQVTHKHKHKHGYIHDMWNVIMTTIAMAAAKGEERRGGIFGRKLGNYLLTSDCVLSVAMLISVQTTVTLSWRCGIIMTYMNVMTYGLEAIWLLYRTSGPSVRAPIDRNLFTASQITPSFPSAFHIFSFRSQYRCDGCCWWAAAGCWTQSFQTASGQRPQSSHPWGRETW